MVVVLLTKDVPHWTSIIHCVCVCVYVQVGFSGTACEDCGPGRFGPSCGSGKVAPKWKSHHFLPGSKFCCGSAAVLLWLWSRVLLCPWYV